jgi:alpha-glucosidase (family GH31 glycosyl hydrolase)
LRWLQYGVFNPIFRPHAHEDVASEPVYKDIITKEKAKKIVELRYQLLPYNYTLGHENTASGKPLMRPLFFEEPANEKYISTSDTYLWGNDFLVKPITKAAATQTEIIFPKNNNWFDFYTDKKFDGGSTQNVIVNPDYIPTFVRGGSFIPMIATIQNTANYSLANFDLHYFFDEKTKTSTGKLYNDDGKTPNAFETGNYEILNFKSEIKDKIVSINISPEVGKNYNSSDKNITFIIHNLNPKKITYDGKNLEFKTNNNQTEIQLINKKATTLNLKIEY